MARRFMPGRKSVRAWNSLPPPRSSPFGPSYTNSHRASWNAVEATDPVIWTKPDELEVVTKGIKKEIPSVGGGVFATGFNAAMCDGSVRFLKKGLDPKVLEALISRAGGEVVQNP